MINIFRLTGDIIHLLSFVILIRKIRRSKNCLGLSLKTQELYLTVFLTRYLDIYFYWGFQTYYLFLMKLLFIGCTAYTIYLMRIEKPYYLSYDAAADDFPHWKVLIPGALVAALVIHRDWNFLDYLWSFSIWLEAVTIFPQLSMLSKIGEGEKGENLTNITGTYVASLGLYRIFYILNWIYRYFVEDFFCLTSVLGGLLQAALYADFLYYYFKGLKLNINPISV